MEQIAPGLRRWTSWHDHWEEDVGSLAVDTEDGLLLIDPLEPPAELGTPAHVLVTVYWHARRLAELGGRLERIDQDQAVLRVDRERADVLLPVVVPGGPAAESARDLLHVRRAR